MSLSFVAGPCIEDPRLFVGRKDQIASIINNMTGVHPTSVNIYGERRIGKSSLLMHIMQTWQARVPNEQRNKFVVALVSLQDAQPNTADAFFGALARALTDHPTVQARPELATPLAAITDGETFRDALKAWRNQPQPLLPVVCIDEFDKLLKLPDQFTNNFYDFMRVLLDAKLLMLILSSKESVDKIRTKHQLTSSFFNLGSLVPLGDLTEEEAEQLVELCDDSSGTPLLSVDEQKHARRWGGRHPYLLQCAGKWLVFARQQSHSIAWARQQFDEEANRVPVKWRRVKRLWHIVAWLLWPFQKLGELIIFIGLKIDESQAKLIGCGAIVVVILVVLAMFGIVQWSVVKDLWSSLFP